MKILTKEILKKIPAIGETEGKKGSEIKVPLKLFYAFGNQRWYITELEPISMIAFGFVNLDDDDCAEIGYIDLNELFLLKSPRFKIERDITWDSNTTLDKVIDFEIR